MLQPYARISGLTNSSSAAPRSHAQRRGLLSTALTAWLGLGMLGPLHAQNAIQTLVPLPNALFASRENSLSVTFSQAVTGVTPANAIHVFGTQTDLRAGGSYLGDNSATFSFNPAATLNPGEQVWVTIAAPAGAGYAPYAYQFTAAAASATASFSAPLQLVANPETKTVATADVNGDGVLDLTTLSDAGITVFLADPAQPASFGAAIPIGFADTPQSLAIADINGDGKPDLLVTSSTTSSIVVGLNTGDSTNPFVLNAASPRIPVNGLLSLQTADLDCNGQLDMIVLNPLTGRTISVYFNSNGTKTPSASAEIQLSVTPVSVIAADVNNDGAIDLITVNDDGTLLVLYNDTNGGFGGAGATTVTVANGATRVIAADMDEDGDLDLVTANLDNTITLLRNVNGAFASANATVIAVVDATNNDGPTDVKAADIDGDGDLDLLTANFFSTVSILRNAGGGSFPVDYSQPGASQLSVRSCLS